VDYEGGTGFWASAPGGLQGVEFRLAFWRPFAPCFAEVWCWPTGIPSGTRRIATAITKSGRVSLHLRVLGFGLLQDGDVGVGVFPEGEEILVGGTGFGSVAVHGIGSTDLEMSQ